MPIPSGPGEPEVACVISFPSNPSVLVPSVILRYALAATDDEIVPIVPELVIVTLDREAESAVTAPDICKDETLSSDPTESPIITLPLNSASCITPWSFIESDGIPETSFTENIVPVKLFVIENNCPAVPEKLKVPEFSGLAKRVIAEESPISESAPVKTIFGWTSPTAVRFGVITIFLSVIAI